jgi:hypothetical protein
MVFHYDLRCDRELLISRRKPSQNIGNSKHNIIYFTKTQDVASPTLAPGRRRHPHYPNRHPGPSDHR